MLYCYVESVTCVEFVVSSSAVINYIFVEVLVATVVGPVAVDDIVVFVLVVVVFVAAVFVVANVAAVVVLNSALPVSGLMSIFL